MKEIYPIILKFFRNEIEKDELEQLNEWIKDRKNFMEFSELQRLWLATENAPSPQARVSFHKTWEKIQKRSQVKPNTISFFNPKVFKYAAIVFVCLNIGWWSSWLTTRNSGTTTEAQTFQLNAGRNSNSRLVLPDNTVVYLRPGSELTYNSDFKVNNRNISLTGEAYFEVTKNQEMPFVVNTDKARIKVLGTRFNVSAEKDAPLYQATLVEGKIDFITHDGRSIALNPNENICYDTQSGKTEINQVDPELYTAWKDGKVIFRNELLKDITTRLERIYHVKFVYKNQSLGTSYRFTGTFYTETSIGEVLTMLQRYIPMKVSRVERFPEADLIYME